MSYTLFFDAIVAVLLAVTIVYAVILNRKLSVLRSAKSEMERLLASFAEATGKAERGLAGTRDAAEGAAQELRRQIEAGRGLADDLAFLVERGGGLADQIDGAITNGRSTVTPLVKPSDKLNGGKFGLGNAPRDASPQQQAAGMATAAVGPDHEGEGDDRGALSPKQAALLKALNAIR